MFAHCPECDRYSENRVDDGGDDPATARFQCSNPDCDGEFAKQEYR